jgi:hypothetical protein
MAYPRKRVSLYKYLTLLTSEGVSIDCYIFRIAKPIEIACRNDKGVLHYGLKVF